jgi:uncharacterized protein YbbC (DUF1343 family)/CubicO group peptidase (beta-lactamase class C family)
MNCKSAVLAFLALALAATLPPVSPAQTKPAHPQSTPSTAQPSLSGIDQLMNDAVARGAIPGGVVLVGHDGRILYRKAYGMRSLEPHKEAMTVDTIFDLASLTKVIATTPCVMKLIQDGKVRLNDPVSYYLPDFAANGKKDITVRELLTHYSGLAPDLDLTQPWQGRDTAYKMAMEQKPILPPDSRFLYSDINFETLGFLVEKVTGMSLNDYAEKTVFAPLHMTETRFLPPDSWGPRIAPTQWDENHHMLRGVVHDPTARRMGGVAGHAGLFSTADDLSKYAQDLLTGFHVLTQLTVEKMSTPQQPPTLTSLRGLGWDIDSPFASNRGEFYPIGSFGHTGFTGTDIWIDPTTDSYVILLTNAVHPNGHNTAVISLRAHVASLVAQSLHLTVSQEQKLRLMRITGYNEALSGARLLTVRNAQVRTGIDVLESHNFSDLRGDRPTTKIALVTNQTGLDSHGNRTIDVLAKTPGLQLTAIFSPEHGIAGALDTTAISNSKDPATGITVYSVYGDTAEKRHPSLDVLNSVDAIVYDIQDVGVRFYTYETTLGYFLEAAAHTGKPIFVLDRPNPINGVYVQGPISDKGRESFIDFGQIPIRHGMTIGELARFYNAERNINANLTVIKMEGWERGDWLDSTGILWINPSPNMRNLTEAVLYPGIGILETTNVSVGRGTDTPFELLGAPWIESTQLASYLNNRAITGVRFVPIEFTPTSSVYENQRCSGVNIIVTDRNSLDAPELGIEIASALHALYPDQFDTTHLDTLMLNDATLKSILANEDPRRIWSTWLDTLQSFDATRSKYLLY